MTKIPPPPDMSPEYDPEEDAQMMEWTDEMANAEPEPPSTGSELAAQAREVPDSEPISDEERDRILDERDSPRQNETGNLVPSREESPDLIRPHTGQRRPRIGYLSRQQREVGLRGAAQWQAALDAHRPQADQAKPPIPGSSNGREESDPTLFNNYELFTHFADASQQVVEAEKKLDGSKVAADLIADTMDVDPKFVGRLLAGTATVQVFRRQNIAQKLLLTDQFINTVTQSEGQTVGAVLKAMREIDPHDERSLADRIAEAKTAKAVRKLLLAKAKEILIPSDK